MEVQADEAAELGGAGERRGHLDLVVPAEVAAEWIHAEQHAGRP